MIRPLLFSLLFGTLTYVGHCKVTPLYTTNDTVTVLTPENITDFIVNKHSNGTKLQTVQFYTDFSEESQSFAPSYKQFAKRVTTKWTDLMDVSVFSCAEEKDQPLKEACSSAQYNVSRFPTMKMFWFKPNLKSIGRNVIVSPTKKFNVNQIVKRVLRFITINWRHGQIPLDFPKFQPLMAANKQVLLSKLNSETAPITVLVVERRSSYLGRELMMDLSAYRKTVAIRRLIYNNKQDALMRELLPTETKDDQIVSLIPFLLVKQNKNTDDLEYYPKKQEKLLVTNYFESLIVEKFTTKKT